MREKQVIKRDELAEDAIGWRNATVRLIWTDDDDGVRWKDSTRFRAACMVDWWVLRDDELKTPIPAMHFLTTRSRARIINVHLLSPRSTQ